MCAIARASPAYRTAHNLPTRVGGLVKLVPNITLDSDQDPDPAKCAVGSGPCDSKSLVRTFTLAFCMLGVTSAEQKVGFVREMRVSCGIGVARSPGGPGALGRRARRRSDTHTVNAPARLLLVTICSCDRERHCSQSMIKLLGTLKL